MSTGNSGKPWDNLDIDLLESMFDAGAPLEQIAVQLQRTGSAVASRLIKSGRIFYRMANDSYYVVEPWMSVKDVCKVNLKLD